MRWRAILCGMAVTVIALASSGCRMFGEQKPLGWEFVDASGRRLAGVWSPEGSDEFKRCVETPKLSGVLTVRGKGDICNVSEYRQGERVSSTSYYPSGVVRAKASFEKGLMTGVFSQYWENGQLAVQQTWRAGVEDGPYRSWEPNGQRTHEGEYVHGKQHGIWLLWKNDETVEEKEVWENGNRVSSERRELSGERGR